MANIIDGKAIAASILNDLSREVEAFGSIYGRRPGLAVVLVGNNPASEVYVKSKIARTKQVGMISVEIRLPNSTSQEELLRAICDLNADPLVDGILVQLPLPPQIDANKVLGAIAPEKDVDGFHPVNVGRLSTGTGGLVPCTPLGCMRLLDTVIEDYRGLHAVVIGKSNIVGKPVALLLLERECTVLVAHIYTRNLIQLVASADILVVAAGSPGLVKGDWIKPGAIVIDVGINRVARPDGTSVIVGDVAAIGTDHAQAITPVPGGVGPMTIASLLTNTMQAANKRSVVNRAIGQLA